MFKDEFNFRELGGNPTRFHTAVKYHLFYRSSGPYRMNSSEREELFSLHIVSVLDMRTRAESEENPDPFIPGAHIIQHSGAVSKGGEDIDFSPAGMDKIGKEGEEQLQKLAQYYMDMPFGNEAIQVMFNEILKGSVPILIHCATGKDRTGVACMCLLMALGCERETVLKDYLLSNVYRRERIDKVMARNQDRIALHPELKELIQMKEGVSERTGNEVLDEVERRYPDYDTFLKEEYGLDAEKLAYLRKTYTE